MARHDEPAATSGEADPAIGSAVPPTVRDLLARLWSAGHAGYVVGGSLRDVLIGREPADWDLTTDARPDTLLDLFPGAVYENRFGTVAVRRDGQTYEITTFRSDHDYADFRRPHRIEFGDSVELDLARRDFTANALAWGRTAEAEEPAIVDPFGGRDDIRERVLRAVGDPVARFEEDALRMVRAVRLATALTFTIAPATLEAIRARAELVRHLSGERVAAELQKLLAAPLPSIGLQLLDETGLLRHLVPELAAQRGVAQAKIPGDDLWDHTLRTVDAVQADRPVIRLAALLHDVGKPTTAADGHFYRHDSVGAEMARTILDRLRAPRSVAERVVALVRHHMFTYDSSWSDTAVRRFIARIGRPGLEELLALREADNIGSGQDPEAAGLGELRARIASQLAAEVALDRADLRVDGDDLITELGLIEGPTIGRILDHLLDVVIEDPVLNDRPTLLLLAQRLMSDEP